MGECAERHTGMASAILELDQVKRDRRGDRESAKPSLSGCTVNGAPASGCIDLDQVANTGDAGYLCVQHNGGCTPVIGQVLSIEGPMQLDGRVQRRRGEFRVTETSDCEHGRCIHVAHFPLRFRDHSWIPTRDYK